MKKKVLISLCVAFVLSAVFFIFSRKNNIPEAQITEKGNADIVRVSEPLSGTIIKSPLSVSGEARGNWFFEASFPVKLLDENGTEIAAVPAQAHGEWRTENFVPFSVDLNFAVPTSPRGTLVLRKDNPSDLPEHDDALEIPIRF